MVVELGAIFAPERPVAELPAFARRIEALGLDQLWVVEDCFLHGGLTAATAALAVTERVRVGVGLLPTVVRNPAIVAMELATVAELHPGRFLPAFGHGVEDWMRQIDARPRDRVVALREVVGAVRALLAGESLTIAGRFVRLDGVMLATPPAQPPPLLVGTTGARTIAAAAEVSDGVVLPEGAGEGAVAWANGALPDGAQTLVYSWLRVEDHGERARRALIPAVRAWRAQGRYRSLFEHAELPAAEAIGPGEVERVAIAGTPRDCAAAIHRLAAAGARAVIVRPLGEDPAAQLERFASDVAPLVT